MGAAHRPAVRPSRPLAGHGQGPQAPTPQQTRPVQDLTGRPLDRGRRERDHPRSPPRDHRTRFPRPLLPRTRLDPARAAPARGLHTRSTAAIDTASDRLAHRHPATLTEEEKLHGEAVLDRCPELASAAELTGSSAEMLTTLSGTRLPEWITEASDAGLPGINSFAAGLMSDFDAVTAGLTTDWNSGPVEGAVNRIKMLKRQMFGRAGFGMLRKRVLLS
ncbi:transposase [Streptomyces sp. RPA4-2]|uniref:transposase n=1 Tax=Streptomyces sp. RPA4-2 TaxID=2721244 RepID=UPI002001DC38|nr:transposase [Streptomyces sp. RPA4-2]